MSDAQYFPGLEGVIAGETAISAIEDGLRYRGYSIEQLARDASFLEVRLLGVSEAVLALGIATGMARQFLSSGRLLVFDHKTLLAILAFALIAVLLILHQRSGLRGQNAARLILVAYLLLTLAYLGVKFVTDVLIG
ncbi:MAG: cytochrome c biogenesis protein CcsA [Proteobacteria bacterium]|nr:cytochrome c biogenesis protein CcsA [Pseudomonadota bacterium]